jgi:hypothetical protein
MIFKIANKLLSVIFILQQNGVNIIDLIQYDIVFIFCHIFVVILIIKPSNKLKGYQHIIIENQEVLFKILTIVSK